MRILYSIWITAARCLEPSLVFMVFVFLTFIKPMPVRFISIRIESKNIAFYWRRYWSMTHTRKQFNGVKNGPTTTSSTKPTRWRNKNKTKNYSEWSGAIRIVFNHLKSGETFPHAVNLIKNNKLQWVKRVESAMITDSHHCINAIASTQHTHPPQLLSYF